MLYMFEEENGPRNFYAGSGFHLAAPQATRNFTVLGWWPTTGTKLVFLHNPVKIKIPFHTKIPGDPFADFGNFGQQMGGMGGQMGGGGSSMSFSSSSFGGGGGTSTSQSQSTRTVNGQTVRTTKKTVRHANGQVDESTTDELQLPDGRWQVISQSSQSSNGGMIGNGGGGGMQMHQYQHQNGGGW